MDVRLLHYLGNDKWQKVIFFNFFGSALSIQIFQVPAKIKMFISAKVKRKIQVTNLVIHQKLEKRKKSANLDK
jgi:hypothetical protein